MKKGKIQNELFDFYRDLEEALELLGHSESFANRARVLIEQTSDRIDFLVEKIDVDLR